MICINMMRASDRVNEPILALIVRDRSYYKSIHDISYVETKHPYSFLYKSYRFGYTKVCGFKIPILHRPLRKIKFTNKKDEFIMLKVGIDKHDTIKEISHNKKINKLRGIYYDKR